MPPSDKRYTIADLPGEIALFPSREALLLPRGRLPLNVFEPRYLSMVDYALAHGRMIGLARPQFDDDDDVNPPLYGVGCAGRIVSFAETGSGRLVLSLDGVSRFRIVRDTLNDAGFRVGRSILHRLLGISRRRPMKMILSGIGLSMFWELICLRLI